MSRNMDILLRLQRDMEGGTMSRSQPSRGLFPLLKSSHSVAPKLHLSHSRVMLSGDVSTSGATQGILSTTTRKAATCDTVCRKLSKLSDPREPFGDLPSFPSIVTLIPGSLSLMKGGTLFDGSPSLTSSRFLAQMFPWMTLFCSCKKNKKNIQTNIPLQKQTMWPLTNNRMGWGVGGGVVVESIQLTRKFSTDASCLATSSFQLTDTDLPLFR